MYPAFWILVAPHTGVHGRAAAGLEERRQPVLNTFRIFLNAHDLARIVHTNDDDTALGVGEGADRYSNRAEDPKLALELGLPAPYSDL